MPTLSASTLKVDTTLPSQMRYISLTDADFDGGSGEGDCVNRNGPDYLDIIAVLGRAANSITIELTKGNAHPTDAAILLVRPNTKYVLTQSAHEVNRLSGQPFPGTITRKVVDISSNPIRVRAVGGGTVVRTLTGNFYNLELDLDYEGSGTVSYFSIYIS